MKLTHFIFFFVSFFAWKTVRMDLGHSSETKEQSSAKHNRSRLDKYSRMLPIAEEISLLSTESKSETKPKADQDLSLSTAEPETKNQYFEQYYDVDVEPNVFQKIKVPVGGPYCYPEKVDRPVERQETLREIRYTPELRKKGTASFPIGITEIVWPYEQGQSSRKKEIREFVQLKVSADRYEDTYRYIGEDAERAFISRYYGFINPTKNDSVDDLIRLIEDFKKYASHLLLDTGPDPDQLEEFNSWTEEDKTKFCGKYINYNRKLLKQEIDFDSSHPDEIKRIQITVHYKHSSLENFKNTLEVVQCPCVQASETKLKLGVLPIRYKYPSYHDFSFAFIYDILEYSQPESNELVLIANVRALVKIDMEGLLKERKKRDKEQRKLREMEEELKLKGKKEFHKYGAGIINKHGLKFLKKILDPQNSHGKL